MLKSVTPVRAAGSTYVHIQRVNAQVVGCEVDTGKYFSKSEVLSIPKKNHLIRILLHFAFDESQKMLLVHARGVVHVSINLANVVKISMRHLLAVGRLLVFVRQSVEIELSFEILQSSKGKALAGTVRGNIENALKVHVELPDCGDFHSRLFGLLIIEDLVHSAIIQSEDARVIFWQREAVFHVKVFAHVVARFSPTISFLRVRPLMLFTSQIVRFRVTMFPSRFWWWWVDLPIRPIARVVVWSLR